ncbi:DNA primase family protein [Nocardiopsis nanhaiensis]
MNLEDFDQTGEAPPLAETSSPGVPMEVADDLMQAWRYNGTAPTLLHWRGTWMRWEGPHWAEVEDREIRSDLYRRLQHATYTHVGKKDGEEVTEERKWAPNRGKIANLTEALAAITHLSAGIDAPARITSTRRRASGTPRPIVACTNGLLRLDDRTMAAHDPRFFNLVSVPFAFEAEAAEPKKWLEFLAQLWPDDPTSIEALQEWFGYVLSGRTDLHKIMLIVGPARSGKGTIGRILAALVGKGNMAGPTLASMATNFGLSPLLGKPLAVVSDARLSKTDGHQVVERLLTISGEDTIDVDRKYRDPWTGRLPTRFLILSNELPKFGDASGAIATRFLVLTMNNSFLGNENTSLTDELMAELPGILNWALDGLARLIERGNIRVPDSSTDAVVSMQDMASPVSAFVRECCVKGPDHEVLVDDMWKAWKAWAEDSGVGRGNKSALSSNLSSVAPQVRVYRPRGADGSRLPRHYQGIALVGPTKDDQAVQADQADRSSAPPRPGPPDGPPGQAFDLHGPPGPPESPLWGHQQHSGGQDPSPGGPGGRVSGQIAECRTPGCPIRVSLADWPNGWCFDHQDAEQTDAA